MTNDAAPHLSGCTCEELHHCFFVALVPGSVEVVAPFDLHQALFLIVLARARVEPTTVSFLPTASRTGTRLLANAVALIVGRSAPMQDASAFRSLRFDSAKRRNCLGISASTEEASAARSPSIIAVRRAGLLTATTCPIPPSTTAWNRSGYLTSSPIEIRPPIE